MPVNSTHPDYDENLAAWLRIRDVLAGDRAIKRGGEKYVARLDSQSDDEFLAYVERGFFYNATALDGAVAREHVADAQPGSKVLVVIRMR